MILYNNKPLGFGKFPNGESYLKKIKFDENFIVHVVTLKYESDEDLFHLLLVKKALDDINVQSNLRITYVPYSRMDRDNELYVFALKTFTDFINSMNWLRVVIYEPHSDVTPALLDRVQVVNVTAHPVMQTQVALEFLDQPYQICYPDIGAFKRYTSDFKDGNAVYGIKFRDFETGKIIALDIKGEKVHDNVVIVDDLCSKGGTFVMAAKKLREMGFTKIVLSVAHCEDTIYNGELFDHLDKVITTNSILSETTSLAIEYNRQGKLQVIPLTEFKWR